jgi:hypothetical protein
MKTLFYDKLRVEYYSVKVLEQYHLPKKLTGPVPFQHTAGFKRPQKGRYE